MTTPTTTSPAKPTINRFRFEEIIEEIKSEWQDTLRSNPSECHEQEFKIEGITIECQGCQEGSDIFYQKLDHDTYAGNECNDLEELIESIFDVEDNYPDCETCEAIQQTCPECAKK